MRFRSPCAQPMLALAPTVRCDTYGSNLAGAAVGQRQQRQGRRIAMGYRTFRDSKGTEWQAWDVVPQLTERREIERRVRMAPVEHADRRRNGP